MNHTTTRVVTHPAGPAAPPSGPPLTAAAKTASPRAATKKLTNDILLAISERYPMRSLIWRQNVTVTDSHVRSCPNGTADIIGVIQGRAVGIEVKTGKDQLSAVQRGWRDAWVRAGGIHIEARDVNGAMRELEFKLTLAETTARRPARSGAEFGV